MKKHILAVCVLSAVLLSSCGSTDGTSAGEVQTAASENVIYYEGTAYSRDELSSDTIKWLEVYNSLSEESKLTINYIPYELLPKETFTVIDALDDMETFTEPTAEETESTEFETETEAETAAGKTVNTYYAENVFEAAGTTADELTGFSVWKGSPHRDGSVASEAFFTEDEGTPDAALKLAEKIGSLTLGKSKPSGGSRFERSEQNYCVITGGGIARLEFYCDGENAEINVWNTVEGSTFYFDMDIEDYGEISALAEELIAYKTPVTYDDKIIRDVISEDYAAVMVNTMILTDERFTDETAGRLMELLRNCEYTPLPDDVEESYCPAELYLYKNIDDTEPITLRLCSPRRNHSTESYKAIAVLVGDKEYFYSITRDEWEKIYRLTDWGPNYVI